MGIAVVVIANDFSAINVALPTMEQDFDTNVNTIQWVVNAYALTFGVMIVTGGRLADMFGRRNAFFLGTAIFASMSALGGAAQTETLLIASRVLMGIGGALMWPAILGSWSRWTRSTTGAGATRRPSASSPWQRR
jgi:MFS family permease